MAVSSANEIWDSRQGSIDQGGQRSYTREFRVITDDWTDGPKVVRQATGIPRIGDPYAPSGTETDTAAIGHASTGSRTSYGVARPGRIPDETD